MRVCRAQDIITHHVRLSKLRGAQGGEARQQWAAQWLLPAGGRESETFMIDRSISNLTSSSEIGIQHLSGLHTDVH